MSGQERVLDQLAYLIDEIEAQLPFLSAIPPAQLEGVPFEGERSVKDYYLEMLGRERSQNMPALGVSVPAREEENDVPTIARELMQARRRLVDCLSREQDWNRRLSSGDVTILDFAHGIALLDAESLQAIAQRFHEGNFRFSRQQ